MLLQNSQTDQTVGSLSMGAHVVRIVTSLEQGPLQQTGDESDIALQGEVGLARRARDDDAHGGGDQEGGRLGGEAVADREQREGVHGPPEAHPSLEDADADAAEQVDGHDQDAGHGIAVVVVERARVLARLLLEELDVALRLLLEAIRWLR